MKFMTAKTVKLPMPAFEYETARGLIKSGDIVSFYTSHEESVLHRFTTEPILWFTGSRIYHTGVAIWVRIAGEDRLMLSEAVGVGRRIVNMSKFKEHKMEIHQRPDDGIQFRVESFMMDGIGQGYAFGTLVSIGLKEWLGWDPKMTANNKRVCSQVAAESWEYSGMQFDTTTLSPGKLRNTLIAKGVPTFVVNQNNGTIGPNDFYSVVWKSWRRSSGPATRAHSLPPLRKNWVYSPAFDASETKVIGFSGSLASRSTSNCELIP